MLTAVAAVLTAVAMAAAAGPKMLKFEVHGKVQGVWFRRSTREKADELACFGWVQNTARGTVVGEARCGKRAGPRLQQWLERGPEMATVERAHFHVYPDTKIKLHFSDFAILEDERRTAALARSGATCPGAAGQLPGPQMASPLLF